MRPKLLCDVVGCNQSVTFRSRLEEQYGVTLCDPDNGPPRSMRTAMALGLSETPPTSHYLTFHAVDSMGKDAVAWIKENCTVEYACGHRGRKSSDYLCAACRSSSDSS